jgi:CzcA family heavy metal efflux pump
VQASAARMRAHGVSLDDVMETTAESMRVGILPYADSMHVGTGGFIDTPNQRLGVHHVQPIESPQEMAQIVIVKENGVRVKLGDVADIVEGHQPMVGDAVINDEIGLMLIVEKFPWANTLEVTKGVEDAIEALRPGLTGYDIDTTIFRPATFIQTSIDNLTSALLIGALLVVVVLFVFLYEWRTALISLVAIPLSLMAAAMVLYISGTTMNTMVLAGFVVALGAVVDDALVDIENIVRRLRQNMREGGGKSVGRIVLEASLEIRTAIIFATLIIVLAVVPIFFMEGLSGAFFKPLALSYTVAMLASLVVAMTVTPALALILLRKSPPRPSEAPLVRWLHRGYERVLTPIVRAPRRAYATVGVMVLAGVVVWPMLGQSLLPDFKERDFLMHWLTKPGTSWPEMQRITIQGSRELRAIPGVRNFGAHIGQALIMDEVVGMYFGENWISVDPAVDYDKTLRAIQETVDGYPGLYRDVQTYLKERIREVLTGSSEAVVVRMYGPELAVLRGKANEVKEALSKVEGLIDVHVELVNEIPQIEVKVDLEKASRYGLKPGDVRRAASHLIVGQEVADMHKGGKVYDVNAWSPPAERHSLTSIRELQIDTPDGGYVRLQDVADVGIGPTPNVIKREWGKRRIDVGGNVRGRDLGSVVADVKRALATVDFPQGYNPELIGEHSERQAAQKRMLSFALLSALGIFLLLHVCFNSVRLAALSFLTLPAALVGGVLAAYASSGVISLGSLVGFLTVLGIAARNGILLINHYQRLERREGMVFGPELVLRGARDRLAPILMTAITTALALTPLVIAGDIPGHEIELPMAIVILGGIVTSTLLNLFVIPSLYLRFGSSPEPEPAAATAVIHQA